MSGWDQMRKAREEAGSSGLFIKMKDGDTVAGVFRGEPYCFYSRFKDKEEYQERVEGASFKFRVNFITKENDKLVARIFQGGRTLSDQILDMIDEYGGDHVYKIKRVGSGKEDTRYTIFHKESLNPERLAEINSIKLLALTRKGYGNGANEPPPVNDEDLPVFAEEGEVSFP